MIVLVQTYKERERGGGRRGERDKKKRKKTYGQVSKLCTLLL